MGAVSVKYSDAQKTAAVSARLDRGMAYADIVAAAAAGRLRDGLEPFEIGRRYLEELCGQERRRRRATEIAAAGVDGMAAQMAARVWALLDKQLRQAESVGRRGKLAPERVGALADATRKAAAMARELERGARDAGRGKTSPAREGTADTTSGETARDFLTDLAAQHAHQRHETRGGERDH
jgi:hypothetical protein